MITHHSEEVTPLSSEVWGKELMEAIYDIKERVTRIEEGQKRLEKIETSVDITRNKADEALLIAKQSEQMVATLSKEVEGIKTNNKWAWGLFFSALLALATTILSILFK